MKAPSAGKLSFAVLCLAAVTLVAIGPPRRHPIRPRPAAVALPPAVSEAGFAISSVSVDLPIDDGAYPDGPHVDVINANCTSCHSPSMVLTQPRLAADQWKAIVEKMRETYKAPVPASDVPAILAYLDAMSGKLGPEAAEADSGQSPLHAGVSALNPRVGGGMEASFQNGANTDSAGGRTPHS